MFRLFGQFFFWGSLLVGGFFSFGGMYQSVQQNHHLPRLRNDPLEHIRWLQQQSRYREAICWSKAYLELEKTAEGHAALGVSLENINADAKAIRQYQLALRRGHPLRGKLLERIAILNSESTQDVP